MREKKSSGPINIRIKLLKVCEEHSQLLFVTIIIKNLEEKKNKYILLFSLYTKNIEKEKKTLCGLNLNTFYIYPEGKEKVKSSDMPYAAQPLRSLLTPWRWRWQRWPRWGRGSHPWGRRSTWPTRHGHSRWWRSHARSWRWTWGHGATCWWWARRERGPATHGGSHSWHRWRSVRTTRGIRWSSKRWTSRRSSRGRGSPARGWWTHAWRRRHAWRAMSGWRHSWGRGHPRSSLPWWRGHARPWGIPIGGYRTRISCIPTRYWRRT